MADISASNWSQTDASNNSAAPDGFPENMNPSGLNNGARAMMGAIKRRYARSIPATTAGTTTAYTLTYTVAPASYADGETFLVRFNQTCGSSPTLNINSLGAVPIYKYTGSTFSAVASGDLTANIVCELSYNTSAGAFLIVAASPVGFGAGISLSGTNTWTGSNDFTGSTVAVATATAGDNDTTVASTAFVTGAISTHNTAALLRVRSLIWGLTYSNGTDATNDLDIAAGGCMDATGAYWIAVAALTKQSDAAWAVGTAAGGLDDIGSAGNNDFYIWAIARSDTGVTDILYSLSSTAPTMPTNYDYKRLIGWFKRSGGTIVAFKTYELEGGGLELAWNAPRVDVALANTLTTSRRTDALSVPLGFSVLAHVRAAWDDASTQQESILTCPDETDAAPSQTTSPLATVDNFDATNMAWEGWVRTSSTGTVASRSSLSTVDVYRVATLGFRWSRR